MPASRNDLLSVTRSILRGAIIFDIAMIALFTVVLAGALAADPARMTLTASGHLFSLSVEDRVFAVRVGLAGALACCILIVPLLRQMLGIVETARGGDPFVPENGVRLKRTGWLLLGINIVYNIAISVALTRNIALPPVNFTVVLTVLMIFVLARIFETGSRMRAELQETI